MENPYMAVILIKISIDIKMGNNQHRSKYSIYCNKQERCEIVQFKSEHPVVESSDAPNMSNVEVWEKEGKSSILKCIKPCTIRKYDAYKYYSSIRIKIYSLRFFKTKYLYSVHLLIDMLFLQFTVYHGKNWTVKLLR